MSNLDRHAFLASPGSQQPKTGLLMNAVALFGGLVLGLTIAYLLDDIVQGILIGMTLALAAYPFLRYREDRTIFAPVYIISILLALSYPLRLLGVIYFPDYADVDSIAAPYFFDDELVRQVLFLTIIGQLGFLIGYYKAPKGIVHIIAQAKFQLATNYSTLARNAFILSYAIWGLLIFRIQSGMAGSYNSLGENYSESTNQILSYASSLNLFAGALAVVWLASNPKKRIMDQLLAFLAIIPLFIHPIFFDPGGKTALINALFLIIAAWVTTGRKLRLTYLAVALTFFIFFVWPYVGNVRSLVGTDPLANASITARVDYSLRAFEVTFSYDASNERRVGDFLRRFGAFDSTLITIARVPSAMEYTVFRDLVLVPFVFIPRIVFPIKPVSETQKLYSENVYGMISGGAAAPFVIGEGYLNAGELGVFLLTWVWGIFWAVLYRGMFIPRRQQLLAIALYVALLTRFATSFEWALMSMIGFPSFMVVWLPVLYWLSRESANER
jgi:hypothetical protein